MTGSSMKSASPENSTIESNRASTSRREIDARLDSIVEFSGLEDFIDEPVKTYSSGMYVRLGFAVAINVDPDILVVDEVLAVGDAAFQQKCYRKMQDVIQEGRTIFFVSHDSSSVLRLCERALLIESGRLKDDGPAEMVVKHYLDGVAAAARA